MTPTLYSGPSCRGLRVGLLGGSFNPAHAGHRAMSLYALKRLALDQVWWLVSPQNPLKGAVGMASLAARAGEAARVAARHPGLRVLTLESALGTRYTVDTLAALGRRFPHTRFVWLMGADNWRGFTRWKRWRDIMKAVPIAVFRRPGYAAGHGFGRPAQRFDAAFHGAAEASGLANMTPPAWLVLDNKLNALSATQIRQQRKLPPNPSKGT